jgi:hypothetical protein
MIVPVEGQENKDVEIERAGASVIEGELECSFEDDLGEIKAPRVTVRKRGGRARFSHEDMFLEYQRFRREGEMETTERVAD